MAASLLGASALVHIGVLTATGGGWGGAVSFRKPITFGISVGLILWTCGWVIDRLPHRPRMAGFLSAGLVGSGLVEVGLITMQAWRGVPSHFNFTTTLDSAVFTGMGISIGVFSFGLLALTIWAAIERPTEKPTRLAVIAGMALVLTGLGLGQWVIALGVEMAEQIGRAPDTVLAGEAGLAKFPHAMALHGIQLFIATAMLARTGNLTARTQQRVMRMVVSGYSLGVAWSILHTNAGRAPVDLTGIENVLAGFGVLLMAGAGLVIFAGLRHRNVGGAAKVAAVTLPS